MKNIFSLFLFLSIISSAFSQVQVDKSIELTGGSGSSAISGLVDAPVLGTDAVNKAYVDAAVAASGGGAPTMISDESSTEMNYGDALRHCHDLSYNGHSDWHLPTYEELQTVVSTGGVTVPNNTSANFFWFQAPGFTYSGGNYPALRWMRLSDGNGGGTYLDFGTPVKRVRCVR